jgi:hypothetical protein
VLVNGGAAYTKSASVTLAVTGADPAPGSEVASMRFSNDGATWSEWEPFAATKAWMLEGSDGAKTVHAQVRDAAENVSAAATDAIALDTTGPVAQPPVQRFVTASQVAISGSAVSVPVKLSWGPASESGSGLAAYRLQRSSNGGSTWAGVPLASPLATAHTIPLAPGPTLYRFRDRALDVAGNAGTWALGPAFRLLAYQESATAADGSGTMISYTGTWTTVSTGSAYGGYVRRASAAEAAATFTFKGENVAWVATKRPSSGKARITLDGGTPVTIDLYASLPLVRQLVFSRSVSPGLHTLTIEVLGTKRAASSGTVVEIDAFTLIRRPA